MNNYINSNNFNKKLGKLLKSAQGKDIVKARFELESLEFKNKIDFISSFISAYPKIFSITYKILFWEKDKILEDFFSCNFPLKNYDIKNSYKGGKMSGNIFLDESSFDRIFMDTLLKYHFNYELARTDSLNMRLQVCINIDNFIIVLDIYDDRGFNVYYLNTLASHQN